MITRPLELESRLSPPPRDLDFFAWVNLGLIALFFTLLGSRFVLAPALLVGTDFSLPAGSGLPPTVTGTVVVSYGQSGVVLFEGAKITLPELRDHLAAYTKLHPGEALLVVADRHIPVQALSDLKTMAESVGFTYIAIAQSPAPESPLK